MIIFLSFKLKKKKIDDNNDNRQSATLKLMSIYAIVGR